jgi:transposase
MAAAYSMDLRTKILLAYQNKEGSQRQIAARFDVSASFVRNLLRKYRETGEIAAKPQGGDRRSKLKEQQQEMLKEIVSKKSDICLHEIRSILQEQTEVDISISSLSKTLSRLKLRRKKTPVAD